MLGFSAHLQSAPQSFSDPRMEIEAANSDGKLVIFLLVDRFSKEVKAVKEAVLDQIKDRDGEFVIARCNAGSQAHRAMVTDRNLLSQGFLSRRRSGWDYCQEITFFNPDV